MRDLFEKFARARKNIGSIFRHIFQHHSKIFFAAFFFFTLESVLQYSQPYLFSKLFTQSVLGGFSLTELFRWGGLLALLMLFAVTAEVLAIRCDIDFLARLSRTLLSQVYGKLLYFDITLHENESSGKFLGKTRRAVDKIVSGMDQLLYQFFPAGVQIAFVHSVFFFYSFQGGLWLTFTFLLLLSFAFFVSYFLNEVFDAAFEQENKIAAFFVESLSLIRTIRFFAKEDHYNARGGQEFGKIVDIWQKKFPRLSVLLWIKNVFLWAQAFILTLLVVWQYRLGILSEESGLFLLLLVPLYVRSLGGLSRLVDRMADFYSGVEQYCHVIDRDEKIKNREEVRPVPFEARGEIVFDDVSFRYDGTNRDQFDHFSVVFPPRKTTAIVGHSGSGKSTLVKLLFRLYDVQEGVVRFDGIDIREFDQYEYRKLLAIVPQDVELFNASIRENILMGDDFSDEEIWNTLRLAVLDERVQQMQNGLDTEVGERGVKLSGGEKQRLGIARALIRRPKILILDEATSSLDTLSERQVKEAIYNLEHLDITVIVIAHRLSTIQDADEILVFENGRIIERGTHTELLVRRGAYAALQGEEIVPV